MAVDSFVVITEETVLDIEDYCVVAVAWQVLVWNSVSMLVLLVEQPLVYRPVDYRSSAAYRDSFDESLRLGCVPVSFADWSVVSVAVEPRVSFDVTAVVAELSEIVGFELVAEYRVSSPAQADFAVELLDSLLDVEVDATVVAAVADDFEPFDCPSGSVSVVLELVEFQRSIGSLNVHSQSDPTDDRMWDADSLLYVNFDVELHSRRMLLALESVEVVFRTFDDRSVDNVALSSVGLAVDVEIEELLDILVAVAYFPSYFVALSMHFASVSDLADN